MKNFIFFIGLLFLSTLTQGREIESSNVLNYTPSIHTHSEQYFQNWYRSNSNSESVRFSSLKEINTSNVRKLKVAFVFHSNVSGLTKANPIIADNKAIIPLPNNELVAINASNGELSWRIKTDSQPALRGLTYWSNEKIGSRIFFTTRSYLNSISILDGKPIVGFGKNGKVFLENSNLPPIIFEDTIVCATTFSKQNPPTVKGFDVVTGKPKWKTNLMPKMHDGRNPGGNPWGGMSADMQRGIVYVVTGDPSPSAIGINRPGNDLNSNSIVALDIRTGKLLWSFQEIKHDLWDKDIAAPPIVTSIKKNGESIDVVIAITKHGNTIILDRVTGKPLFPWTLRKAPSSNLPGEIAATYQPDIKIPEPFSKTEFKMTDINTFDKNNLEHLTSIVKNSNIGFFPTFDIKKSAIFFNTDGGAQWPGASVDPFKEAIYIASSEIAFKASVKDSYEECKSIINKIKCSIDYFSKTRYVGEIEAFKDSKGYPANKPPWGYLTAIKLTTGKIEWKIPLGRNLELEKEGIKVMGAKNIGAPVATAGGLVFCAGTFDQIFRAFDSSNGNVLWEYKLPAYGSVAPTIYQTNNKEYILLAATGNGSNKNGQKEDSYIAFSL